MIAGLTRSGPATRRVPGWPEEPPAQASTPRPLFEARPPLRKLVVVADADLLVGPVDAGLTRAALLTGLLTHPYIKLLRYRDEGPAAGLAGGGGPPKGWACLLPPDGEEWRGLVYAHGSGEGAQTGLSSKVAACARDDTGSGIYGTARRALRPTSVNGTRSPPAWLRRSRPTCSSPNGRTCSGQGRSIYLA